MEGLSVRAAPVRAHWQSDDADAKSRERPSVPQELAALLRLHVWHVVDSTRLYGRDLSLFLLAVLSLALWVGLDRQGFGPDATFYWYTLYQNGVMALPVLLAGWVLSRLSRPRVELRRALLLILGFLPVFVAATWMAMRLPWSGMISLCVVTAAAAALYLVTGMWSLTGRRQLLAVASVIAVAMSMIFLSTRYYFSPTIWFEPEPATAQIAAAQRENEVIVYEQPARINAAISALAPRDEAKANIFFVGVAGFGYQKVFAEEIGLAAQRIGDRYDASRRSVRLVNDKRDSLTFPLATVPSLRHALKALGQRMNVDEDVLFLALSSHGAQEGTISISSDLGLWRDLEAAHLADILRESGIRWRVIVVSACYSGTFIEPLKDDNTIILTAAAADRKSFGCSDRRDLTYFGEAFYRDALPKAASLRAAFESARVAIKEREARLGMKPSNPQAHFGSAMEQRLAQFEGS
jgi:hypothetical protein